MAQTAPHRAAPAGSEMTATDISQASRIHKTKISRAVSNLNQRRYLQRTASAQDRRVEFLKLRTQGLKVFNELSEIAEVYNARLLAQFTPDDQVALLKSLRILMK